MNQPVLLKYKGKTQGVYAWAKELGLNATCIYRKYNLGRPIEECLRKSKPTRYLPTDRCSVEGCDERPRTKGMCNTHYMQIFRARDRGRIRDIAKRCYYSRDPRKFMVDSARLRARKAGLPFNLVYTDIVIPETCPYLGIPLIRAVRNRSDNSPTLDKIIPERGYVRGNVIVVSNRANRAKSNLTPAELWMLAKNVSDIVELKGLNVAC